MSTPLSTVARGISVKQDWNTYMDQEQRLYNTKLQEKIRAEQKAWQMGEIFKLPESSGKYFSEKINENANTVMGEIGDFMIKNPDWEVDPFKVAYVRQQSDKIRNNEWVQKDIHYRNMKAAHNEWMNDPKNAELARHPDVIEFQQQLNNVDALGDIYGDPSLGRNVNWMQPAKVNTAALIAELATQMAPDTYDIIEGVGMRPTYSRQNTMRAAKMYFEDQGSMGIALRREWMDIPEDERKATYGNNPAVWVAGRITPHQKFHGVEPFNSQYMKYKMGGGSGSGEDAPVDLFYETIVTDFGKQFSKFQQTGKTNNPRGFEIYDKDISSSFVGQGKSNINFERAQVYSENSNEAFDIELGNIPGNRVTPTGKIVWNPTQFDKLPYHTDKDGKIIWDISPDEMSVEYKITMPKSEVDRIMKEAGMEDYYGQPFGDFFEVNNAQNMQINPAWKGIIEPNSYYSDGSDIAVDLTVFGPMTQDMINGRRLMKAKTMNYMNDPDMYEKDQDFSNMSDAELDAYFMAQELNNRNSSGTKQ